MLETQNVPIKFNGGLDTKTDPKLVLPGKLTLLENGVFTSGEQITKRNGYTKLGNAILGTSNSLTVGKRLGTFINELCALDGNRIYSYTQGGDALTDKGPATSVLVSKKNVVRNSFQQSAPDMASLSGVTVYAWVDSRGGVRASVVEQSTDSQIQSDVVISATGFNPRCAVIGSYLFVFYGDGTNLKCRRLSPQVPNAFQGEILISNDLSALGSNGVLEVVSHGLKGLLAYHSGTSVKVKFITQDGLVGSTILGLPDPITILEDCTSALSLSVESTTLNICLLYANGTQGLRCAVLRSDFSFQVSPTTVDGTVSPSILRATSTPIDTSSFQIFYELGATNTYDHLVKVSSISTAGVVTAPIIFSRSLGLASKAYTLNGAQYVTCVFDSTLQATYFVMRQDGWVIAKLLPGQAGGLPPISVLPSATFLTPNQVIFPAQIKTKFISEGNTTFTLNGIAGSALDFSAKNAFDSKTLGDNLHMSGGYLSAYDGMSVTELGFHLFPENITATPAASGGSMADGQYLYSVVYEWVDNRGQTHRSSPGVGVTAIVSGSSGAGQVTLKIPTLRVTAKTGTRSNVVISVYRTKASGTVAYKVTSVGSPTYNDPSVDFINYVDTQIDSAIASNEILYTTGGVIENIAPPACGSIDVYQNRMVLLVSEDPLACWYSKVKNQGEGLQFSDVFYFRVDPLGGDLSAAKMMDDKIILFKNSLLFFVSGDGPADTGASNNYSIPQLVSSDVGCPYPQSVVLMPRGIMFKSNKGIYLLDRSLNVTYIGADVEGFNSQNITSAKLIEDKNQVRFLTDAGSTLVYDYYYNQWSSFTNHEGVDAVIWNGVYTYLTSDGRIMKEAQNHFQDDTLEFRLRIGTAWIKMAGVQGFQRVRRTSVLGNYKSTHTLRMRIGYDYNSSYTDNVVFNAGTVLTTTYYGQDAVYGQSSVYGGNSDSVYQFRAHLRKQKCEAIRFLFEDVTAGTPGESYSLSDLTLEVGMKRGLMKLKSSKSVG